MFFNIFINNLYKGTEEIIIKFADITKLGGGMMFRRQIQDLKGLIDLNLTPYPIKRWCVLLLGS